MQMAGGKTQRGDLFELRSFGLAAVAGNAGCVRATRMEMASLRWIER
jgi:hypothetical protein